MAELAKQLHEGLDTDPLHSPADRIFLEIIRNREWEGHGKRSSRETLPRVWVIHEQSPAALEMVLQVLSLLCERLLQSHFARTGTMLSQALADVDPTAVTARICHFLL
jgi:hypothetical protein